MKWYTLEERPLKEGKTERYLMAGINDGDMWIDFVWMNTQSNLVYEDVNGWKILDRKEIIAYIPLDELELTLPKEKE